MEIFVDTSAIFALLDIGNRDNPAAVLAWENFLDNSAKLVTNNYVLVECFSLLQNRLGLTAVIQLQSKIVPYLEIEWLDEQQHSNAANHVLSANRRNLSLVDCSSFQTMRRLRIESVFSFDAHFKEQGFTIIP